MTAPLFNIKARLSEYVTAAENGNVVEITKHGRCTAVILSIDEYNHLKQNFRPSFIEKLNEWKQKTGGLTNDEFNEFETALSRNKEAYTSEGGIF
jgi:prevent-host-death family protein